MITWVALTNVYMAASAVMIAERKIRETDYEASSYVTGAIMAFLFVPPAIYCVLYLLLPAYGLGPRIEH